MTNFFIDRIPENEFKDLEVLRNILLTYLKYYLLTYYYHRYRTRGAAGIEKMVESK